MRPLDAEILLHYYVSLDNHPRMYAPEVGQTHVDMVDNGLLGYDLGGQFSLTDKGKSRVKSMLDEPQNTPRRKWFTVPDYQPNGTPATTAHVVDSAGQEVATFERIADAEAAVAAVNNATGE